MYLIIKKRSLPIFLFYIGFGLIFLVAPIKLFANQQFHVCEKGSWQKWGTMNLSQEEIGMLDDFSITLCKKLKKNDFDEAFANANLFAEYLRFLYCDKGEVKSKMRSSLDPPWIGAYTLFCRKCFGDPKNVIEHAKAIDSDHFCILSKYLLSEEFIYDYLKKNHPNWSGWRLQIVKKSILKAHEKIPSIKIFREEAARLCLEVKSGTISVDVANYHLEKEWDAVARNVEIEGHIAFLLVFWGIIKGFFTSIFGIVVAIIGAIATIIGILIGLKKLYSE